jgi:hypothetical protein
MNTLSDSSKKYFFLNYTPENTGKIFLYLLLSFSTYAIPWIYQKNKLLEEIDEDAPDSKRGAFVLFFLPLLTYGIFFILEKIIVQEQIMILLTTKILMWSIISFLTLKYIYEFTTSYAKLLNKTGFIFYIFIYLGYLGVILWFFGSKYFLLLLFFPIFTISSMNELLNIQCSKIQTKNKKISFNYMERSIKLE